MMVKPSEQIHTLIKLYQAVVNGVVSTESTPLNVAIQKASSTT